MYPAARRSASVPRSLGPISLHRVRWWLQSLSAETMFNVSNSDIKLPLCLTYYWLSRVNAILQKEISYALADSLKKHLKRISLLTSSPEEKQDRKAYYFLKSISRAFFRAFSVSMGQPISASPTPIEAMAVRTSNSSCQPRWEILIILPLRLS